jgi:hypothetical protein
MLEVVRGFCFAKETAGETPLRYPVGVAKLSRR